MMIKALILHYDASMPIFFSTICLATVSHYSFSLYNSSSSMMQISCTFQEDGGNADRMKFGAPFRIINLGAVIGLIDDYFEVYAYDGGNLGYFYYTYCYSFGTLLCFPVYYSVFCSYF